MKIVQKILSHGLLIAFFVAVFFVYLYRGELFPQWFDKQAQTEETPSPSKAQQTPVVSAEQPPPAQASGTDVDEDEGQPAEPVPTEAVVEAVEQPASAPVESVAVTTDVPADGERPVEAAVQTADADTANQYRPLESGETTKETYNPVAEVTAGVVTAPEYRPLKAKKPAPADVTLGTAGPAAVPAGEADFQSQLEQARQHYWRRDMRAAEQAYRRLTDSHPQRAEVWGELGNFYYSQKEMVQATDVYYRAIELLIEQGDAERARQLLGVIYQLDAEKAKELEAQLRQGG